MLFFWRPHTIISNWSAWMLYKAAGVKFRNSNSEVMALNQKSVDFLQLSWKWGATSSRDAHLWCFVHNKMKNGLCDWQTYWCSFLSIVHLVPVHCGKKEAKLPGNPLCLRMETKWFKFKSIYVHLFPLQVDLISITCGWHEIMYTGSQFHPKKVKYKVKKKNSK